MHFLWSHSLMFQWFRQQQTARRIGLSLSADKLTLLLLEQFSDARVVINEVVSLPCSGLSISEELQISVASFIKEKQLNGLPCYYVLSHQDYQLLTVDPPEVPDSELREAMRWKIKDLVQADIDELAIDIFAQPEKKSVFTVVVQKPILSRIVAFIQAIGLDLHSIDIPELAYRNLLDHFPINDRGSALIVLKYQEGKIMIVKQGQLHFSRRFSLSYGGGLENLPEEQLILEIQRSLDYYERQLGQTTPGQLIFCGSETRQVLTPHLKQNFPQAIVNTGLGNIRLANHDVINEEIMMVSGAALRQEAA